MMAWTLEDFVRESNRIEGILRDPTEEEIKAHHEFLATPHPNIAAVRRLVAVLQPNAALRDRVGMDVRVGNHIPPRGGPEIASRLGNLLIHMEKHGAYKTHIAYEDLHPFMDGNGRSGRALWLWLMGGDAPWGFLHKFYYQTLDATR